VGREDTPCPLGLLQQRALTFQYWTIIVFDNHLVTSNNVIDDVELFFNVKEALNVLVANQLATGLNIHPPLFWDGNCRESR